MSKPCYWCQCCCDPETNVRRTATVLGNVKVLKLYVSSSRNLFDRFPLYQIRECSPWHCSCPCYEPSHNFIDCYCIALNTSLYVCVYIYICWVCIHVHVAKKYSVQLSKVFFFISFWTCFRKEVYLARYDENGVLRLFHHTHDDTVKERVARIIHDGLMEMWDVEQLFDLQVIIQEKVRSTRSCLPPSACRHRSS